FYGEHADRLIVIEYEDLAREPRLMIDLIYERWDCLTSIMTLTTLALRTGTRSIASSAYRVCTAFPARFSIPIARACCRRTCLNASPTSASGARLIRPNAVHLIWRR